MQHQLPRGWLGTSAGVFSLEHSDRYCGSYISVDDAARILDIRTAELAHLPAVQHGKKQFLTDRQLGRAWASGSISSPRSKFQRGSAMISFDELILLTLFEMTLGQVTVEPQIRIGGMLIDFKVEYQGQTVFIEFCGPYHFINRSRTKPWLKKSPVARAHSIRAASGVECVVWPYWIQRCASNVKAIFDEETKGIGSIWSTSAHFGDFAFENSAEMVQGINSRFRIERDGGVGYMYTDDVVAKPTHPIVRRIREGREPVSRLIPPGSLLPPSYWLPAELWPLAS